MRRRRLSPDEKLREVPRVAEQAGLFVAALFIPPAGVACVLAPNPFFSLLLQCCCVCPWTTMACKARFSFIHVHTP